MTYKPEITDVCLSLIEKISNKKTQAAIIDRIEALRTDPEKQGKALVGGWRDFVPYMPPEDTALFIRSMIMPPLFGW